MKTVCLLLAALAAVAGAPFAHAQERFAQERLPEAHPSADEVRALRQMVEKQSREIDELRLAIEELTKVVQVKEGVKITAPLPAANPPATAPAPEPPAPAAAPHRLPPSRGWNAPSRLACNIRWPKAKR